MKMKGSIPPALCCAALFLLQNAHCEELRPNSVTFPRRILQGHVDLRSARLSEEAADLARQMDILQPLQELSELRSSLAADDKSKDLVETKLHYYATKEEVSDAIQTASLEVDFVLARIAEDRALYDDISQNLSSERDKKVAVTNAASFVSNGVLWAVGELLDVPTYKYPRLSIPSGILGAAAGLVPSVFSLYAMKQVSGRTYHIDEEPNILCKIFGQSSGPENEYPPTVLKFLTSVPPGDPANKTRIEQLIERWVTDKNIPQFTVSTRQSDIAMSTGSGHNRAGVNLAVLQVRKAMLDQLGAEIFKMKRLLLELMLASKGQKQL